MQHSSEKNNRIDGFAHYYFFLIFMYMCGIFDRPDCGNGKKNRNTRVFKTRKILFQLDRF